MATSNAAAKADRRWAASPTPGKAPAEGLTRRSKLPYGNPPGWMSRDGKLIWRQVTASAYRLDPLLLDDVDLDLVAHYCQLSATAREASKSMRGDRNSDSVLSVDESHGGGLRKSPAWQVYREAVAGAANLAKVLGLTPVMRQRLSIGAADDGDLYE